MTNIRKLVKDFKKNYYDLLENSLKHPQIINVSDKITSKSREWNDTMEYITTIKKIYSEYKKGEDIYYNMKLLIDEAYNTFSDLVKIEIIEEDKDIEIQTIYNSDIPEYKGLTTYQLLRKRLTNIDTSNQPLVKIRIPKFIKSKVQEQKTLSEENISKLHEIKILLEQYSIHKANAGYCVLTYWPIFLFFLLEHSMSLKSIFLWPNKIADKKLSIEINEVIYSNLKEIREKLIDFISESKHERMKSEIDAIKYKVNPLDSEDHFKNMVYDYSILNMKEHIIGVLKSLMKIQGKEVELDEFKFLDEMYKYTKTIHNNASSILDLDSL